jgi:hypothetical protein
MTGFNFFNKKKQDEQPKAAKASPAPTPPPQPEGDEPQTTQAEGKSRSFLGAAFYYATSPIWWPLSKAASFAKDIAWDNRGWKGKTFTALVAAPMLVTAFAGAATYGGAYGLAAAGDSIIPYSDGIISGYPTKVRQKGRLFPCQTWEASIAMDSLERNDSGEMSNRFNFTVREFLPTGEKSEMIQKLEEAESNHQKVTIHYRQSQLGHDNFSDNPEGFVANALSCVQKSQYVVDHVEILNNSTGTTQAQPTLKIPGRTGPG